MVFLNSFSAQRSPSFKYYTVKSKLFYFGEGALLADSTLTMKRNLNNPFPKAPISWLGLFAAALGLMLALSYVYEVQRAKNAVSQYVEIWEEDLAKSLLLGKDPVLLKKILAQLQDLHPAVEKVALGKEASLQCTISNQSPITLYSLPAGQIGVCYSPLVLGVRTMLSPIFLLGVFVAMGFVFVGARREFLNQFKEQELRAELEKNQEIAAISRQVAHDIRGPLMALNTLSTLSHEMSDDKQQLFSLAVSRIKGISEDLLTKSKNSEHRAVPTSEESLQSLVEKLIKEFTLVHTQVSFKFQNRLYRPIYTPLESQKLLRVLSNLINNGIESLADSGGVIAVTLLERNNEVHIQIMDNGSGIPEEVLPHLMKEGASFGKENGNGLGLYDAQKTLTAVNGQLHIQSKVGVGTQITLSCPLMEAQRRSL